MYVVTFFATFAASIFAMKVCKYYLDIAIEVEVNNEVFIKLTF